MNAEAVGFVDRIWENIYTLAQYSHDCVMGNEGTLESEKINSCFLEIGAIGVALAIFCFLNDSEFIALRFAESVTFINVAFLLFAHHKKRAPLIAHHALCERRNIFRGIKNRSWISPILWSHS